MKCDHPHTLAARDIHDENDKRLHSLNSAVELARINHFLGVFLDADLLVSLELVPGEPPPSFEVPAQSSLVNPRYKACGSVSRCLWCSRQGLNARRE